MTHHSESGEILCRVDELQKNLDGGLKWEQINSRSIPPPLSPFFSTGTYVTQVTATDADDPTYGNSARVVYSILHGQPYFSVDPKTGKLICILSNSCINHNFE